MSRPSFQFYPDNYMNDACLRRCSKGARGVWIDLLCLMHQGRPYGHLSGTSGKHPDSFLARWCGETERSFAGSLAELTANGVYSLTDDGVIFSRRMVRDEHNRNARGAGGAKSALNTNVPRKKGILSSASEGILRTGDDDGEGESLKKEEDSELSKWAQKTLAEYPGAQFLPGQPDAVIVARCLKLAHGDARELAGALNLMYKAGKKPNQSWAWFCTVLPQYLENGR